MKLVLLLALFLAITAASAFAAADEARAVRQGRAVTLANPARLADRVAADLASCSVNFTSTRATPGAWDETLASGSYVHATYSPPRTMSLFAEGNQQRAAYRVDEILIPLPEGAWPKHNLAPSEGKVSAFVKCDPRRLAEIIREPELRLQEVQPYKSLMDALERRAPQ